MGERFSSGDRHLDAVLGGGLPANALNMIIGLPGSGKTILAEQFMFHNASPQRPGMYLSTVSEPLDKILRYGQGLDFFDAEMIGAGVFFSDLGQALNEGGLDEVLAQVRAVITLSGSVSVPTGAGARQRGYVSNHRQNSQARFKV